MALQLFPHFSAFLPSQISPTFLSKRFNALTLKKRSNFVVLMSASDSAVYKMNLNEYMVTLEKPLGIRFALSLDGKIFVHSLRKGGNAERSKIIMVGDTLKKASEAPGAGFNDIKDLTDAEY